MDPVDLVAHVQVPTAQLARLESILQVRGLLGKILSFEEVQRSPIEFSIIFSCAFFVEGVRKHWDIKSRIYLAVCNCNEVNAVCTKIGDDDYVIVLSGGLIEHVLGLGHAIISCESAISFLALNITPHVTEANYRGLQRLNGYPHLHMFSSDDEFEYSRAMAVCILCCVSMHELGHVSSGHIDLKLAARHDFEVECLFNTDLESRLTLSALEYDADCFVALSMLAGMKVFRQVPSVMKSLSISAETYVKWTILASAALFIDSGVEAALALEQGEGVHPSKGFRLYLAIMMMGEVLIHRNVADEENAKRVISESVEAIYRTARLLAGSENDIFVLDDGFFEEFERQSGLILGRWARLHPLLSRFKLTGSARLALPSRSPL